MNAIYGKKSPYPVHLQLLWWVEKDSVTIHLPMQDGNTMESKYKAVVTLVALLGVFSLHGQAHAYLDPGTGSMILQALIAGVAFAAVTIKMYWYKIVAFLKGEKLDEDEEDWLAGLDSEQEDTKD